MLRSGWFGSRVLFAQTEPKFRDESLFSAHQSPIRKRFGATFFCLVTKSIFANSLGLILSKFLCKAYFQTAFYDTLVYGFSLEKRTHPHGRKSVCCQSQTPIRRYAQRSGNALWRQARNLWLHPKNVREICPNTLWFALF